MCASFIRVTDCSIRVSRSFTGGCSPPALLVAKILYMIMIIKTIEIYNIRSGTALLLLVNPCILHQNNHTVRPTYILILLSQ